MNSYKLKLITLQTLVCNILQWNWLCSKIPPPSTSTSLCPIQPAIQPAYKVSLGAMCLEKKWPIPDPEVLPKWSWFRVHPAGCTDLITLPKQTQGCTPMTPYLSQPYLLQFLPSWQRGNGMAYSKTSWPLAAPAPAILPNPPGTCSLHSRCSYTGSLLQY